MENSGQTQHSHTQNARRLIWALCVIVVFMIVEAVGGVLSGSLALLADATHMLTDAFALGLAAWAQTLGARPANGRLHFGYRRVQVLAAFANGVLLTGLLCLIAIEAFSRFANPREIDVQLMLSVAVIGLGANVIAYLILHQRHQRDLNMRGAVLHVVSDLLGSVAAIVAAIVIMLTGWMQIDPLLSLLVAALIGFSAFKLIRETSHILLEGAPAGINRAELKERLEQASPLIKNVHNIQIWQLTPDHPRLTLHACVEEAEDAAEALEAAKSFLEKNYNLCRSTIQIEVGEECPDRFPEPNLSVEPAPAVQNAPPNVSAAPALAPQGE